MNSLAVKINGKIYPSIRAASGSVGIGEQILRNKQKILNNSGMSQLEFVAKIPTNIVMEKIK